MRQYTAENLVIRPGQAADPDVIVEVTPEVAGWDTIHFQARRLAQGRSWSFKTGAHELALVVLGGTLDVMSNRGQWPGLGRRANVFAGLPYALYLPIETDLTVTAATDCEFAAAWVAADQAFPPRLITRPRPASKSAAATTPPGRSTACCRPASRANGWSSLRSTPPAATGPAIPRTNTMSTRSRPTAA